MHHFTLPLNWENQYDFNAVYYSVTQVNAGSQLLNNGFTNTYGLYPHFLQPFFNVFGLSVANFTLIMSLLIVFTFLSLLLFLYTNVKDKLLVFLGFFSAIFFTFMLNRIVINFDAYFANFPIRTTTIAFLFLFISLYLIARQKKETVFFISVYYIGMLLLPFGILWNFEYGAVSFITWIAFLCFIDFYNAEHNINWKKIITHIGIAVAALLFDLVFYGLLQLAIYGHFPDFKLSLSMLTLFSKMGYFQLPMSVFHPWMLVILTYILGLIYAIAAIYKKKITKKSSAIFAIAILGCGIFTYYQGRSHNWNLAVSFILAFTELVLLTDELLDSYRESRHVALIPMLYLSLACLLFSPICIFSKTNDIQQLANQTIPKELKTPYGKEKKYINEVKQFIDSCQISTNQVLLFCSNKYQGLFMENRKMQSAVNPGILDLFFKKDIDRYVAAIIDSSHNAFLGNNFYYNYGAPIRTALASEYNVQKCLFDTTTLIFAFLNKREVSYPQETFFTVDEQTLIHEKYTGKSDNFNQYHDAGTEGLETEEFPAEFTIELLIRPDSLQFFPYPIVFSNATDTSGIALIKNSDNSKNVYMVSLGKLGFNIPLTPNSWNYITLCYSNRYVHIYINGKHATSVLFPTPYQNSTNRFYIGNNNSTRNFFGIISEIAVSSGIKNMSNIQDTWQNIQKTIQP